MRRRLFVLLVAGHAAFLLAWAGWLEWGRPAPAIRLDVVRFDPRDLVHGDFVALRYTISLIPPDRYPAAAAPRDGDRVWILLEPTGDGWRAVRASPTREALRPSWDQVAIAGTVRGPAARGGVEVEYGIERYDVPEGKGVPPRGRMQAEVALGADGRAHLLRLIVDGRGYP